MIKLSYKPTDIGLRHLYLGAALNTAPYTMMHYHLSLDSVLRATMIASFGNSLILPAGLVGGLMAVHMKDFTLLKERTIQTAAFVVGAFLAANICNATMTKAVEPYQKELQERNAAAEKLAAAPRFEAPRPVLQQPQTTYP